MKRKMTVVFHFYTFSLSLRVLEILPLLYIWNTTVILHFMCFRLTRSNTVLFHINRSSRCGPKGRHTKYVRLSVRLTLALSQNDSGYDHGVITAG